MKKEDYIKGLYDRAIESGMSSEKVEMNKKRDALKIQKLVTPINITTSDTNKDQIKYKIGDQDYNVVSREEFDKTIFPHMI